MNNVPFTDANTLANEYGAYFTALTTACGALVNATVGGYYASLVSAVQTAFNSQRSSESTLITSAISKENSFNTSVLGLSTTYATAEINADYAYYNALINSHASELQTALTNEQTLIAAELACYRAFSDAAFAKETGVVTANANAARRQLVFTESYGNSLLGSLWEGLPGYDFYPNETVQTVSTNPLGVNSTTLLERVPISYVTPEDPEDEGPDYWTVFNPLNASVLATATRSAQLVYDAATEAAYATFITTSMTAYSAGVSDELDAARAEVVAELGARSTFNTSIMNALDTANTSYRTAVGASDLSAAIESYQNAYYDTDATLNSSVASAFGTFQIGVRQDRLAGVTSSNPRYSAYASDVTWATQTKSLRDQTLTQYNAKQSAYVTAVAGAQKSYNVNALSSLLDAAGQTFTVSKTHALQTASTRAALELADYDAEDARARAYLTAYVDEALANATYARDKAQARATAYAQKLGEVENAVNTAKLHGDGRSVVLKSVNESESGAGVSLDGLEKLKRQIDRVYATANAADAALASADEAAIAADKAANQATREAAIDLADETASAAKRAARDEAFASLLGAAATAKGSYKGIADDLDEALATQIASYNTTIRSANATFSDGLKELDKVYSYYQGEIDLFGGSVPANAYPSEPQLDYEICFVAGTPVLMADGSRRPIESLRPGDVVLAANHLNPESTPAPAKVVRFFDNGEKPVVRLVVGEQELICTPEHPFYVVDKGWVRADALVEGDLCLNARGERVAFVSREEIAGTWRVYNIEVEGAHTFFVGDDCGVLAHNKCNHPHCPFCGGTGQVVNQTGYYPAYSNCICDSKNVPDGFLERLSIVNHTFGDFANPILDNEKNLYAVRFYPDEYVNYDNETITTIQLFQEWLCGGAIDDRKTRTFEAGDDLLEELRESECMKQFRSIIAERIILHREEYLWKEIHLQRVLYPNTKYATKELQRILSSDNDSIVVLDTLNTVEDHWNAEFSNNYTITLFMGSFSGTVRITDVKNGYYKLEFEIINETSYQSFRRGIFGGTKVNSFNDDGYMHTIKQKFKWSEVMKPFQYKSSIFYSIFELERTGDN